MLFVLFDGPPGGALACGLGGLSCPRPGRRPSAPPPPPPERGRDAPSHRTPIARFPQPLFFTPPAHALTHAHNHTRFIYAHARPTQTRRSRPKKTPRRQHVRALGPRRRARRRRRRLQLLGAGAAGRDVVTTTRVVNEYTTYCPGPTTLAFAGKKYTVTKATTLTIKDCPCTIVEVRDESRERVFGGGPRHG